MNKMNSKEKGDTAEIKVLLYLKEKGHSVCIPFGDNNRYDLVFEEDKNFKKVQVKYVSLKNGCIVVPLSTTTRRAGKCRKLKYTNIEIDYFFVYCPQTEKIYSIPLEYLKLRNELTLRVESPKKRDKKINFACNYEL